ncbi:nuclear transport factor 2 family protein [Streptomyces sp. NPDC050636]|uniref:nuclear transport factor 2 family protein n=1 Tax=Streptomyces sp. NPDC050636 TaxID=3154510 RepID=UPI0034467242
MPSTSVDRVTESTDSYQQIQQFYAQQMQAGDGGDFDAWGASFTESAVFLSNGLPEPLNGRSAIVAATRAGAADRAAKGVSHRHVVSMLDIRPVTEGTVAARSYVLVIASSQAGGATLHVSTVCEDRLVSGDGGWQVAERRVTRDDLPAAAR